MQVDASFRSHLSLGASVVIVDIVAIDDIVVINLLLCKVELRASIRVS